MTAAASMPQVDTEAVSSVALVRGMDRAESLRKALALFERPDVRGRPVYIKANFNSADPYPATTHPDTLAAVVEYLRSQKCGPIRLVERSGMGETAEVLDALGIVRLARELQVELLPLESLPSGSWVKSGEQDTHWKRGFEIPAVIREGAAVVLLCCLKTHRFGGQFSVSLKNTLGLVAKVSPADPSRNYMAELHASPHQRLMIAEVNAAYKPLLVVLDALQAFIDGGPEKGDTASPNVIAVSRDRVAVDSVGVALLRIHGAGAPLDRTPVFELDQIRRAVELKLGCSRGEEVRFITGDGRSAALGNQISALLTDTGDDEKKKP
jgi:uncharacterized protein (DUF362 family)